jgi:hypothetical protein
VRTYSADYASQILNATQEFTENYQDPRASMFVTAQMLLSGLDQFFAVFLFYNGVSPPKGFFDKFLEIPFTEDHLETQSYSALVCVSSRIYSKTSIDKISLLPMRTLGVFTGFVISFEYASSNRKTLKLMLTS